MRLICPNCDAEYEVAEDAIPEAGRDVQCSNCGHAWFQPHPRTEAALAETDETETKPEPPFTERPLAPAGVQQRVPDDSVLAVLREEAEREVMSRRAEAARPIEVQVEMGLDQGARPPPSTRPHPPASQPIASPDTAQQTNSQSGGASGQIERKVMLGEPTNTKPAARRELLPDIEEINSTLRPSTVRGATDGGDPAQVGGNGFRYGFVAMMVLAALAALVYATAPQLAAGVPALTDPLTGYVAFVDGARLSLDQLVQSATGLLQGFSGDDPE